MLADVPFEKRLVCKDMRLAIKELVDPVQVIFSSYTLHHLKLDEKFDFIKECQNKLANNGFFILVDGVLGKDMDRNAWLIELERRMRTSPQDLTDEEVDAAMDHPRKDDFPDSIATFENIAKKQNWGSFEVKIDNGILAFMIFKKEKY